MLNGRTSYHPPMQRLTILVCLAVGASGCASDSAGGFMAACFDDSDCEPGLECFQPNPLGSRPEVAYCSSRCSSCDYCREFFAESRAYCAAVDRPHCRQHCDVDSDCPGDAQCPDICRIPP